MYLTLIIRDGLPETVHMGLDRDAEVEHFLDACKTEISNFDEYSPEDIEVVLDSGWARYGLGTVVFLDLTNTEGYQK